MFDTYWLIESIGLTGSLLVALSMTMQNIKILRILNLLGCVAFGTYGIIIQSFSVTLLNVFTAGANTYFLFKFFNEKSRSDLFDVIFKNSADYEYISRFVNYHINDIKRFFPSFNPDLVNGSLKGTECCIIMRRMVPVSLVVFRRETDAEIKVVLDYAIKDYRDFKSGRFFFERAAAQIATPGTVFVATGEVPAHSSYLVKLGFTVVSDDENGRHFRKEYKG